MTDNSQYDDATIRMFVAYCRKTLVNAKTDYLREQIRHSRHERPFTDMSASELSATVFHQAAAPPKEIFLQALNLPIAVRDNEIASALMALSERDRTIILLSYFLGWPDVSIAERTGQPRSTVQFRRQHALAELRTILTEPR